MKLTNIKIQNFKGIKSIAINPQKINVILGSNGKGKSSLLSAIRFMLTGEGQNVINNATVSCGCCCEVDGNKLFRTKKAVNDTFQSTLKINGKTTTQKSFVEMIKSKGIPVDCVKFVTSSDALNDMKPADISAFLLNSGLLPINTNFQKIVSLCSFTQKEANLLSMVLNPNATISLEDIQKAYNSFFEKRKELKKQLEVVKSKIADIPVPARNGTVIDAEYEKLLELEAKSKNIRDSIRTYNAVVTQRNNINTEAKAIETEITKLASVNRPNPQILEKLEKELSDCDNQMNLLIQQIATLESNIKFNKKTLAGLDTEMCPLCPDKLVCNTDKSVLKNDISELLQTLEKTYSDSVKAKTELTTKVETIEKKITTYKDNEKVYQKKIYLIDKRNTLLNNMPALPVRPAVSQSVDYTDEKNKLKAEKKEWITYENTQKYISEKESLEKELQLYENIVKMLSPKAGIREVIIDSALAPLADECNNVAKMLNLNFELKLVCKEGVHLMCKTASANDFVEYEYLSSGEKLIVEFLFMDLINTLSGFGILMLDNLDKLDKSTFEALLELITKQEVVDRYDHIFIAAVNHDDFEQAITNYPILNVINM